ncbi:MAG: hypothetical protein KDJ74_05485 [Notoacmeibacter sp.]|nr:hypothetical protein [Notoacmeibacter sp.]
MKHLASLLLAGLFSLPAIAPAEAQDRLCGWYVVLGCTRDEYKSERLLEKVRGIVLPGSAGTQKIESSDYPNFNPGFFCVVDGPFDSQIRAENVHWGDVVPKAYVKQGC